MAIISSFDAKTIDELQELGKLTGTEKTIVSNGTDTRKVSIDSIVGYAASRLSSNAAGTASYVSSNINGNNTIFIPEGENIPVSERIPGCFYLEETKQTSIRTNISIPTSVTVNNNLGLRRV